jgi:hypothetical protein
LVSLFGGKVQPRENNLYVGKNSFFNVQNHLNLRTKMNTELPFEKPDDLHYSLYFSVSDQDWPRVRQILVDAISKAVKVIRPSAEERLGAMCVDFHSFSKK